MRVLCLLLISLLLLVLLVNGVYYSLGMLLTAALTTVVVTKAKVAGLYLVSVMITFGLLWLFIKIGERK